ncbi:nucleotide exchange factor GrpE [Denitratimonas sp. CY0512]|jgi:molecular chaperone GrpE|uniref:nucleotide exchange factor GrpE n=1 Tax=Denitratimonas sp. CY0512 TaxID=3131940 RepID=UPI0030A80A57
MTSENQTEELPPEQPSESDELAQRVEELEQQLAQAREDQLRERAELENLRKRLVRDAEQARRFANEKLLADLLPVFDSLEAGLSASGDVDKVREGVELTLRQLLRVAEASGLSVVDPAGSTFDPERHQAMSMVQAEDQAPGTVVQVYQKGYVLNERLLRPALVVVATE